MKDDNKPNLLIYILLTVVFVVLIASCGGGGGGGGGMSYASDSNMPKNGGDASGWGTGTETGSGGIGGSSIQEDNATLLLGQSAALSYQKVDIDLIVNGEHFAINNVTATTTTEVLPKIPIGATVSGTATIYLNGGTTRTALLEMTEIGIHNNLVFKVPYNYKCVDATSVTEITSGTYFSRDGIDLSSYTVSPIIGWKCQNDGSVHAGGYITGVRGDITLEPLFDTGVTYNITYVSPITSQSVLNDTYTSAASKTLPVLSESNLTFAGWYDNQSYNGQPVVTIPLGTTGDKTYYAKWTARVTFDSNGGVVSYGTDNVTYNSPVNAPPVPTRSNYNFGGWYTDSACTIAYNFTAPVMQDITLYAKWNVIPHSLSFDLVLLSATGGPSTTTFNQHEGCSLPSGTPTCSGLTFAGWYSDSSYTTAVISIPIGTNHDVTLYAKWTATVTFYKNDGTTTVHTTQNDIDYGGYATTPSNPSWTDHRFLGWYADSACTTEFDCTTQQIMQDTSVYAGWIVSFSGNGEKGVIHEMGKTNYDVELLDFNRPATQNCGAFTLTNSHSGTIMNVNLNILGTNSSTGWNHGGLKLTSGSNNQGGTINVVFTTTSTTGATLELGFKTDNSGDIQVENVTANFSVAAGCTVSDMKVGDTTYSDFSVFINAAINDKNSSRKASFKITRN